jgi:hypothetical protein
MRAKNNATAAAKVPFIKTKECQQIICFLLVRGQPGQPHF